MPISPYDMSNRANRDRAEAMLQDLHALNQTIQTQTRLMKRAYPDIWEELDAFEAKVTEARADAGFFQIFDEWETAIERGRK